MNKERAGIDELCMTYPILKSISEKSKTILKENMIFKKLEEGSYLKSGECPGVIFIINGRVKIEKINNEGKQTSLYEIVKGELCHESLSCDLECIPLTITGYAIVDTQIAILPRELARIYLLQEPAFLQYIYRQLYAKLHTLIGHKEAIIHESIEERVWKFLEKQKSNIVYATHQEIAMEVGSSREVISRQLKKLEKEGHIELGRGKIKIKKRISSK